MPWAGIVDLIVTKMFAAPIRAEKEKQQTDLYDLVALLPHAKRYPAQADYTEGQWEWVKKELEIDDGGLKADLKTIQTLRTESGPVLLFYSITFQVKGSTRKSNVRVSNNPQ